MSDIGFLLIAAILGIAIGFFLVYLFGKLPEKWLQDYDYDETAPDFRLSKRMKAVPHGIIAAAACAIFYCCCIYFSQKYDSFLPLHATVLALSVPVIIMVMMANRLNRIIPDEFSIFLLVMGVFAGVADFIEGSVWFDDDVMWYIPILNRVLALLIGAGFLFLIEFLCETFLGREGMGQGDIKLLGACGLLVGCYGLVILVYVAVFSALFFAIPLLIRKNIRIRKEKEEIRSSKDPVKTRREIAQRKAAIHYADDPDYLAFGPFLAFGAAVFLSLEPMFYSYILPLIIAMGVKF